jgi:hypothetical protein
MQTETVNINAREEMLKGFIKEHEQELKKIQSEEFLKEQDRDRAQKREGLKGAVESQEKLVAKTVENAATAYATLKTRVEERFRAHRGRFDAENSAGVVTATNQLVLFLNSAHEQELSLSQIRARYEDALRLENSFATKQK